MSAEADSGLRAALESLLIPAPTTLKNDIDGRQLLCPAAWADSFVTTEVARSLFQAWNPGHDRRREEICFLRAFRDLLRRGAALGLRVDRFRDVSATLGDAEHATGWLARFEDVVDEVGAGAIRLHLSTRTHEDYQRDTTRHGDDQNSWRNMLAMMFDGLFYELGVEWPPIEVRRDDSLGENSFRLEWNDLVLPAQRGLDDGRVLVNDTVDRLTLLNIKGEEAVNPANGSECATIAADAAEVCKGAGLTTWGPGGYVVLAVSSTLRRNAAAFVTRAMVDMYLLQLEAVDAELITLVERNIDRDVLVNVLRGLAAEEISIRNMRRILQFCLRNTATFHTDMSRFILFDVASGIYERSASDVADTRTLVDNARVNLKRMLSHKYTRGGNTLVVYLLDSRFENRLRQPAGFTELERQLLLSAVRDEVGNLPPTAQSPVILTTMEVRYRMRELIRSEFPQLAVVSYQELSPDMNIQPIARISAESLADVRGVLLLEELDRRLGDIGPWPVSTTPGHSGAATWVDRIVTIADRTNKALDRERSHTSASRRGQRAFVQALLCSAAEAEAGSDHRMRAWKDLVTAVGSDGAVSDELRALLSRIATALRSSGRTSPKADDDGLAFVRRMVQGSVASLPEPRSRTDIPVDLKVDALPEQRAPADLSDEDLGEDLSVVAGLVDDFAEVRGLALIDPATVSRAWLRAASLVAEGKSDLRLVASMEVLAALDPDFPSLGLVLALGRWFAGDRSGAWAYLQVQLARPDGANADQSLELLRRWGRSELVV